ncbi:hypothetical protein KEM52_000789 [Ascosphaera acerosa]|nr:hypothetical protein KEM52_000789 [Ascosphaera acerosa]
MPAKTILVTGASRGIGLAVVQYLLAAPRSCQVVAFARTTEALDELSGKFSQQLKVISGDAAVPGTASAAIRAAVDHFGGLDGLIINHATLGEVKAIINSDIDSWRRDYEINFFSAAEFVKAAIPHLRQSNGRVVMTSSGAAVKGYQGWALYGSTKAAMNHLNMTLAREEPDIISVAIRPGVVDTKMQVDIRSVFLDDMGTDGQGLKVAFLNGQLLKPEQPGTVIANLALSATKDLSGQFLS